jgi:DNA polymerase-3 subunit gamma/tau
VAEDTSLATKYRPETWEEVVGQDAVVKSMKVVVTKKSSKCFLLSGPSGCGKTTLARIAARSLGIKGGGALREIDAASKTGVDDMRQVCVDLGYKVLGGGSRGLIVDECHQLSKAAWNSLLKITEEPPPDTYWFFCTTEPSKVPVTIKRRSPRVRPW